MLPDHETLRLIRLAKEGDNAAKEQLLKENANLMKSIVRRYLGKGTEYDDLYQLAGIGLLKAISGFDEVYEVRFSTYAVPLIAGEIKRFLRDDGSIKVSRTIKQKSKELSAYIASYTSEHGESPTVRQLAEAFSMDESDVVFVLDSSKMPLSLYAQGDYKDEQTQELIERIPSKDFQEEWLDKLQLKSAIEKLSERERRIILLRYFRDMTQSEVAREIGVSQVQISRIESRILEDFKKQLE